MARSCLVLDEYGTDGRRTDDGPSSATIAYVALWGVSDKLLVTFSIQAQNLSFQQILPALDFFYLYWTAFMI